MTESILLDQEVVGHGGTFEPLGEREVTDWITREHWNNGIVTAALSQCLLRIPTRSAKDNLASRRVLNTAGLPLPARTTGSRTAARRRRRNSFFPECHVVNSPIQPSGFSTGSDRRQASERGGIWGCGVTMRPQVMRLKWASTNLRIWRADRTARLCTRLRSSDKIVG